MIPLGSSRVSVQQVPVAAAAAPITMEVTPAEKSLAQWLENIGPLRRAELLSIRSEDILDSMVRTGSPVSCVGCRSAVKARLTCGMATNKNHRLAAVFSWEAMPHSHAHGIVSKPKPSFASAHSSPSASRVLPGSFHVRHDVRDDPVRLARDLVRIDEDRVRQSASAKCDTSADKPRGTRTSRVGGKRRHCPRTRTGTHRCPYHSLSRDKAGAPLGRDLPWAQAWEQLDPEQRRSVTHVSGATVERAVESHLRHYHFCGACSQNVWCVFDLLMGTRPNSKVAAALGIAETQAGWDAVAEFAKPFLAVTQVGPIADFCGEDSCGGDVAEVAGKERIAATGGSGEEGSAGGVSRAGQGCGISECPLPVLDFDDSKLAKLIDTAERVETLRTWPDGTSRSVHATTVQAAQDEIEAAMGKLLRERVAAAWSGRGTDDQEAEVLFHLALHTLRRKLEQAMYDDRSSDMLELIGENTGFTDVSTTATTDNCSCSDCIAGGCGSARKNRKKGKKKQKKQKKAKSNNKSSQSQPVLRVDNVVSGDGCEGGAGSSGSAGELATQAGWMGISVPDLLALQQQLETKKRFAAAKRAVLQQHWAQYCSECGEPSCEGACRHAPPLE